MVIGHLGHTMHYNDYGTLFLVHRLQMSIQEELNKAIEDEVGTTEWQEFVVDLWEVHLPHFHVELFGEGNYTLISPTCVQGGMEENDEVDFSGVEGVEDSTTPFNHGSPSEQTEKLTDPDFLSKLYRHAIS